MYDPILSRWTDNDVKLLEIGVRKGGSLELWRDYFAKGTIAENECSSCQRASLLGERIQLFKGSQADTQFLSNVAMSIAPAGF